jgi:hypothetical protein
VTGCAAFNFVPALSLFLLPVRGYLLYLAVRCAQAGSTIGHPFEKSTSGANLKTLGRKECKITHSGCFQRRLPKGSFAFHCACGSPREGLPVQSTVPMHAYCTDSTLLHLAYLVVVVVEEALSSSWCVYLNILVASFAGCDLLSQWV